MIGWVNPRVVFDWLYSDTGVDPGVDPAVDLYNKQVTGYYFFIQLSTFVEKADTKNPRTQDGLDPKAKFAEVLLRNEEQGWGHGDSVQEDRSVEEP